MLFNILFSQITCASIDTRSVNCKDGMQIKNDPFSDMRTGFERGDLFFV